MLYYIKIVRVYIKIITCVIFRDGKYFTLLLYFKFLPNIFYVFSFLILMYIKNKVGLLSHF